MHGLQAADYREGVAQAKERPRIESQGIACLSDLLHLGLRNHNPNEFTWENHE
jgi:hypothetical protein